MKSWVLLVGLGGTSLLVSSVVLVLVGSGAQMGLVIAAAAAVIAVMGVATAAAHFATGGVSAALAGLRHEVVGRAMPTDEWRTTLRRLTRVRELADLVRTVDTLHGRVRLSDEVAERHRLSAAQASSGMSRLLEALVAAEEGARGQLAAELHDTVAQTLILTRHALAADDPSVPRVADLLDEADEQLRGVMARTRPPQLRDGDLAQAVRLLVEDLELRYGLRVVVRWPDDPSPLPLAVAVTVYRFIQESLLNVAKHADVDDAEVQLQIDGNQLQVWVGDRGVGLPSEQAAGPGGRRAGLGLMRERARAVGGVLDIGPRAGGGTVVHLVLSLPAPPEEPSIAQLSHAT